MLVNDRDTGPLRNCDLRCSAVVQHIQSHSSPVCGFSAAISGAGHADEDYGILLRLFDTASGRVIMIAGGMTTFGASGAACVFFDPEVFGKNRGVRPKGNGDKELSGGYSRFYHWCNSFGA